eukprot:6522436-Alexandrium_andersonii.AAC.2
MTALRPAQFALERFLVRLGWAAALPGVPLCPWTHANGTGAIWGGPGAAAPLVRAGGSGKGRGSPLAAHKKLSGLKRCHDFVVMPLALVEVIRRGRQSSRASVLVWGVQELAQGQASTQHTAFMVGSPGEAEGSAPGMLERAACLSAPKSVGGSACGSAAGLCMGG